MSSKRINLKIF